MMYAKRWSAHDQGSVLNWFVCILDLVYAVYAFRSITDMKSSQVEKHQGATVAVPVAEN